MSYTGLYICTNDENLILDVHSVPELCVIYLFLSIYVLVYIYLRYISITYYLVHSSTYNYVEGIFLFISFFECMSYVRGGYDFLCTPSLVRTV